MRKDEWNDAIEHIDEQIFEEVIDEKMKYRSKRRRTKILRAAALATALAVLAAAVPVTALALRTPEQPGDLPAVAQTEEKKTNEETKEKTTADEPTDIDKTTENKATEAETTTEETTDTVEPPETTEPMETVSQTTETEQKRPVFIPRVRYGAYFFPFDDYCNIYTEKPLAIIQIEEITNTTWQYNLGFNVTTQQCDFFDFTEIKCSVLYSTQGWSAVRFFGFNSIEDCLSSVSDISFYMPNTLLASVHSGDIVLCELFLRCINNPKLYPNYAFLGPRIGHFDQDIKDNTFRFYRFEDGKLVIENDLDAKYFKPYNRCLDDYFQKKIDEGYDVINKEITDRIPKARIVDGATVDDIIEICEWYREISEAIKCIQEKNSGAFYYVF